MLTSNTSIFYKVEYKIGSNYLSMVSVELKAQISQRICHKRFITFLFSDHHRLPSHVFRYKGKGNPQLTELTESTIDP